MKTILSIFFLFLSFSVLAQTMTPLDGYIDLSQDFEKSRVVLLDASADSKIKFVSTGISGDLTSFKIKGDLTLNGVTKQVTFDTRYVGIVADGYGQDKVAFIGKTKVYRQNGEEVSINLRLLANRPSKDTEELYETVYHMVK